MRKIVPTRAANRRLSLKTTDLFVIHSVHPSKKPIECQG